MLVKAPACSSTGLWLPACVVVSVYRRSPDGRGNGRHEHRNGGVGSDAGCFYLVQAVGLPVEG